MPVARDRLTPLPYDPAEPKACHAVNIRLAGLLPIPATGRLILRVRLMESAAAGAAFYDTNLLCVAALSPFEPVTMNYQQETLVHEIGHLIGMVPSGGMGPGPSGRSRHGFVQARQGPVLLFPVRQPLPLRPARQRADPSHTGACVMFGGDCQSIRYCVHCAKAVRKVDMSNGWPSF